MNPTNPLPPGRREEREGKEGMKNPELPAETKKYRKEFNCGLSRNLQLCFVSAEAEKSTRYRLTKGIPKPLHCAEGQKSFHAPFLNCQWINTCIISAGSSILWQLYH